MNTELLLCIPGPWPDRTDFIRRIITLEPMGRHMFAGGLLADLTAKDHVPVEWHPSEETLPRSFEIAGQGKLPSELLRSLEVHRSVALLHFPADVPAQAARLRHFSDVLQRAGGIAVKVESAGVAHTWERWHGLLGGTPFDQYAAVVTLIADSGHYVSCGMHHFGEPECEVPTAIDPTVASDLMNRFNFWRIVEKPTLRSGETFSLSRESPHFRLALLPDSRHVQDDPFFNPYGVWRLRAV